MTLSHAVRVHWGGVTQPSLCFDDYIRWNITRVALYISQGKRLTFTSVWKFYIYCIFACLWLPLLHHPRKPPLEGDNSQWDNIISWAHTLHPLLLKVLSSLTILSFGNWLHKNQFTSRHSVYWPLLYKPGSNKSFHWNQNFVWSG